MHAIRRAIVMALLASAGCPVRPPSTPPAATREPSDVELLQGYLRIDTTNPPGNELVAARFLKQILDRDGIESRVLDLGGGRANLWAVLPGDGTRRPVVLLHHLDVVSADASRWSVPPFSGAIRGGEIYGRGTVDIKGKGMIDLLALRRLKRRGGSRHRDVILLAVADEEVGSRGTRHIVERAPALLRRAELLIDEGGGVRLDARGRVSAYLVSIGEKAPLWLTVTFFGSAGHGSLPLAGSSVNRAVRAAARVIDHRLPPRLLPELREWLGLKLEGRDLSRAPGFAGDLAASVGDPRFLEHVSTLDPEIHASLHDTIAVTGLRGSPEVNTIPAQASIRLDCRLLPGTARAPFIAALRRVMDDPTARVTVDHYHAASASPADGPLVRALRASAARRDRGARVIPTLLLSSTDSPYYRERGIQAYGFEPYRLTDEEANRSHGDDERLRVSDLAYGVDLLVDLLDELDRM